MEVNDLLKKVRKIELKTRDISNHLFSGEYHSMFKGRGMSFSEVREYQYSDDVRHIDWNVTARTGVPFVKVYEEERELIVLLAIDVSKSSFFGTGKVLKSELVTELSAVLAFSAMQNNDKVGLLLFSDKVECFIAPAKGRNQILRIIRELLEFKPENKQTNIDNALHFINKVFKKRCICFLVSDFIDSGYNQSLRVAGRRHDMIAVHVTDPAERILPRAGLIRAIDPETGQEGWVDTDDDRFRKAYAEYYVHHARSLKQNLGKNKVDLISVSTDEDYLKALMKFFRSR